MVYDIFGTDDPRGVGPNAPLNDTCASSSMRAGSAVSAVAAWTGAAFPARQIALGVASYGHSYNITPTSAGAFNASGVDYAQAAACGVFDARVQSNFTWDGTEGEDRCGNPLPSGGVWNFNAMVGGGYLGTDGKAASGVEYRLDACSQTVGHAPHPRVCGPDSARLQPYVYSPATHELISYDDAASFGAPRSSLLAAPAHADGRPPAAAKGDFIRDQGLLGFAMWELAADYDDILLTAISDAMKCPD
jgi:chitinase